MQILQGDIYFCAYYIITYFFTFVYSHGKVDRKKVRPESLTAMIIADSGTVSFFQQPAYKLRNIKPRLISLLGEQLNILIGKLPAVFSIISSSGISTPAHGTHSGGYITHHQL